MKHGQVDDLWAVPGHAKVTGSSFRLFIVFSSSICEERCKGTASYQDRCKLASLVGARKAAPDFQEGGRIINGGTAAGKDEEVWGWPRHQECTTVQFVQYVVYAYQIVR